MAASPWASQAALDALLKYGPQKSVLGQQRQEAIEQYAGTVRGSAGAAQQTVQAIKGVRPNVAAIYDNAGLGAHQTGALLGSDLASLGAAADPYKAAATVEQAGAVSGLQHGKAQALNELAQRMIQAKEGGQFAANQAGVQLGQALAKLGLKQQSLAGEEGAYKVSDSEKLTHEHENLQQKERASERSAGIDPNTGKPIPGGKLDKQAKAEVLPLSEQAKAASTISSIRATAGKYSKFAQTKGHSLERQHLVELLSEGQPSESVGTGKLDAAGKEIKQKTSAVPAYKPDVLMSAALDAVEYGYLQKGTQHRLEQAGYNVGKIGIPTYGQWAKSGGPRKAIAKPVKEAAQALSGGF
jgi:hypothetical protein